MKSEKQIQEEYIERLDFEGMMKFSKWIVDREDKKIAN